MAGVPDEGRLRVEKPTSGIRDRSLVSWVVASNQFAIENFDFRLAIIHVSNAMYGSQYSF